MRVPLLHTIKGHRFVTTPSLRQLTICPCVMLLHSKRFSGVPEELVEEVARKYVASISSGGSQNSMRRDSHGDPGMPSIPESKPTVGFKSTGTPEKPRALIQRVAELEKRLPPHMERLNNGAKLLHHHHDGAPSSAAAAGPAHSSKSAPEGSLLNRVEVLEEAMDALLVAQEAALLYQQQLIDAQQEAAAAAQAAAEAKSGCCVIS